MHSNIYQNLFHTSRRTYFLLQNCVIKILLFIGALNRQLYMTNLKKIVASAINLNFVDTLYLATPLNGFFKQGKTYELKNVLKEKKHVDGIHSNTACGETKKAVKTIYAQMNLANRAYSRFSQSQKVVRCSKLRITPHSLIILSFLVPLTSFS